MIRNKDSKSKFYFSLLAALVIHAAILAFLKYDTHDFAFLTELSNHTKVLKDSLRLDNIDFIKAADVEKYRTVGIKNGKKDLQRPDISFKPPTPALPKPAQKGPTGAASLSLEKLAPELPKLDPTKKTPPAKPDNQMARNFQKVDSNNDNSHFYFNSKTQKVIDRSQDQEILKNEAIKNFNVPSNKATDKISNFEIRYERPEGVSEDELNSDEKAYYSFYVRSYQNYYSKIYSNYEKIVIERPGLAKVFDKKHLLIGKIDYDENGNIVTVKIIKSSDSDDLHYFFEETLKQLSQPNPPKIFVKNRKQFSIFYQLQIN